VSPALNGHGNVRERMSAAIRSQLFSFHSHVNKPSKVLIKGGDWHVLGHGGGADQTVDKVICVQRGRIQHRIDLGEGSARGGVQRAINVIPGHSRLIS